ncbi:hypothetical protein L202_00201 [Cryptococcus amylolentus CBS 6039]|uniref:Photolyase/cryptochrome alpha/beta domain-containing protein n=1 Tax=Cryptococcus amylolentus CBS 6039 TaxID=1295533 RepID=A0A1E3I6K3_9TREE|nr:hypothetical protein L202_00201 [Cryptococcus amylolentus CBS 6039]ODN84202.1 hypothetical protein L202_00201 [Cryptococcus amylolentus CBS 6039]
MVSTRSSQAHEENAESAPVVDYHESSGEESQNEEEEDVEETDKKKKEKGGSSNERKRPAPSGEEGKVATAEDAARMDNDSPIRRLYKALEQQEEKKEAGESVVYWMRMEDLRIEDNTALSKASEKAKELGVPLLVLAVLSPGDYNWHDRSPRRIDFMLRNLRSVQSKLDKLNIPLIVKSYDKRLTIPRKVITDILPSLSAAHLFGNIEYEVDELTRDIKTVELAGKEGIEVKLFHDRLAVPPGRIFTQAGKPMQVYSPWQRVWARILEEEPKLLVMSPLPEANDSAVRKHVKFSKLFDTRVPESVEGFECRDQEFIAKLWPEGTEAAKEATQFLDRFLHTKAQQNNFGDTPPISQNAENSDKDSRIQNYGAGRNLIDGNNSSKLSPYLASGVISVRQVLNEAKKLGKSGKLESGRETGVGMWVQEVAWRDFYNQASPIELDFSMGRPFQEKLADVQWETSESNLQAWKDGKTGYPIVDAAMRALNARGWMENRLRMVTANFLIKELMLDWRLGERYFMQSLIDGDLPSNNGGWQWVASTGTDPQPYFRIFNTITQSEKCDPEGSFIRHWVPELKDVKGKAIHDPHKHLSSAEFERLGYPAPLVEHKEARERALFRYKNVGEVSDEE